MPKEHEEVKMLSTRSGATLLREQTATSGLGTVLVSTPTQNVWYRDVQTPKPIFSSSAKRSRRKVEMHVAPKGGHNLSMTAGFVPVA